MLVGHKVHGIRRPQDLTSAMARNLAHDGWLTDNQYLAILANPDNYEDLRQADMGQDIDNILAGAEECFFMCDQNAEDEFYYDVNETYGVMFDIWRLTVTSSYTKVYEKKEYTMRNGGNVKLVHYQPNNDAQKHDKVDALAAAADLNQEIQNHGESSSQRKEGILGNITGRRGRGRGRGGRGGN